MMKTVLITLLILATITLVSCHKEDSFLKEEASTSQESLSALSHLTIKKIGLKTDLVTKEVPFGGRAGHTSFVFKGYMWVIAGNGPGFYYNDVWYSKGGANWIAATINGKFKVRYDHAATIHDNKMWVAGGEISSKLNDVWFSYDGKTWAQATDNAAFSKRSHHTLTAFNGRMWLIGGNTDNGEVGDNGQAEMVRTGHCS